MTGLTDPMDDFYDRHPELVDLDRALDECHRASQGMLERLAEAAPTTEVDDWLNVAELGLAPGDVALVVDSSTGYKLAFLARLDTYVVDPDAEETR